MVAAKILGHCGPLLAIQVPLMVVEEAKREEGKPGKRFVTGRQTVYNRCFVQNLKSFDQSGAGVKFECLN